MESLLARRMYGCPTAERKGLRGLQRLLRRALSLKCDYQERSRGTIGPWANRQEVRKRSYNEVT